MSKRERERKLRASEKYSEIRLRLVLGFGKAESSVTFARMIAVKPDRLKWWIYKQVVSMGFGHFFFQKMFG